MSLSFHYPFKLHNAQVSLNSSYIELNKHINSLCVRTKDDTHNHVFIHLNLCIALALGLVVFIAGIENATNNKVVM